MSRFVKLDATGNPAVDASVEHVAVLDTTTNLIWTARNVAPRALPHAQAMEACTAVNLLGKTDWRAPTVEELFAIADRATRNPAIDTDVFPGTESDWYWSSSPASWSRSGAWLVSFDYGGSFANYRDDYGFMRAVRSASASQ